MQTIPVSRLLLQQQIDAVTIDERGRSYQSDMLTVLVGNDGGLVLRPFKLADIGTPDEQYEWLYREVMLEEHAPEPFTDWQHLEVRGKGRYRKGTGKGWSYLRSTLEKYGVPESESDAMLSRMLNDGKIIELGEFQNSCAGGNFMMYGAV